jgi:hypothetical protein
VGRFPWVGRFKPTLKVIRNVYRLRRWRETLCTFATEPPAGTAFCSGLEHAAEELNEGERSRRSGRARWARGQVAGSVIKAGKSGSVVTPHGQEGK